jgi:hypothetical protein
MIVEICNESEVKHLCSNSPEGRNTKFLRSSHNLWTRFKNYENNPPFILRENNKAVALIFATMSQRSSYVNLYEIVTVEGQEGKGHASNIWDAYVYHACSQGMNRIKLSCTPTSVTWHARNGVVFWAVDPTGSLRSDQPLFKTRKEQCDFRDKAIQNPSLAFPDTKVCQALLKESLESHSFGEKKTKRTLEAIDSIKDYWLRDALVASHNSNDLTQFIS